MRDVGRRAAHVEADRVRKQAEAEKLPTCDCRALAQKVPGLDVIIGGHSHTRLETPAVVNQTISGLACGKPIRGKVAFLGGPLHFLPETRRLFVSTLGLAPESVRVPECVLVAPATIPCPGIS